MPRDPSKPPRAPPSTRRTIYSVLIVGLVAFLVFRLNLYIKYPKMAGLKAGDKFPAGVVFSYVPWTDDKAEANMCGRPIDLKTSEEWKDKKVVLFAVPGAFTPTCAERHLPSYISNVNTFKEKGVDVVACIGYNDAFVMSAFGKVNGVTGDDILFMTDPEVKFSSSIGWLRGERTERYALVIDNGVVTYAEKEPGRDVTVSSAESVLATL